MKTKTIKNAIFGALLAGITAVPAQAAELKSNDVYEVIEVASNTTTAQTSVTATPSPKQKASKKESVPQVQTLEARFNSLPESIKSKSTIKDFIPTGFYIVNGDKDAAVSLATIWTGSLDNKGFKVQAYDAKNNKVGSEQEIAAFDGKLKTFNRRTREIGQEFVPDVKKNPLYLVRGASDWNQKSNLMYSELVVKQDKKAFGLLQNAFKDNAEALEILKNYFQIGGQMLPVLLDEKHPDGLKYILQLYGMNQPSSDRVGNKRVGTGVIKEAELSLADFEKLQSTLDDIANAGGSSSSAFEQTRIDVSAGFGSRKANVTVPILDGKGRVVRNVELDGSASGVEVSTDSRLGIPTLLDVKNGYVAFTGNALFGSAKDSSEALQVSTQNGKGSANAGYFIPMGAINVALEAGLAGLFEKYDVGGNIGILGPDGKVVLSVPSINTEVSGQFDVLGNGKYHNAQLGVRTLVKDKVKLEGSVAQSSYNGIHRRDFDGKATAYFVPGLGIYVSYGQGQNIDVDSNDAKLKDTRVSTGLNILLK